MIHVELIAEIILEETGIEVPRMRTDSTGSSGSSDHYILDRVNEMVAREQQQQPQQQQQQQPQQERRNFRLERVREASKDFIRLTKPLTVLRNLN